jgi:hypothetical protein
MIVVFYIDYYMGLHTADHNFDYYMGLHTADHNFDYYFALL